MATARDTALSINMVMSSAIKGADFLQASVYGIYKYAKAVEKIDLLKRTKFPLLKRNLQSLENHLGKIRSASAKITANPIRLDVVSSRNSLKEVRKDITALRYDAQAYRNYTKLASEDLMRGAVASRANMRSRVKKERKSIGAGGVVGTAMAVAPMVVPLKGAVEFESSMLRVKALSGASEAEFKSMRNKALELGAKTEYKSTQVATGMQYLVMAGFKPKEINKAMPGVLNLATAGNIDLQTTADISSNILGGFELPAKKMGMVADIMAKTITTANVDIRMLGDSMKYAAPIAKKAGLSLAETSAMAGLLGNIGIQGTMAGTTLKSMITRLSAPPKEAQKILDKLHIETADKKGRLKSIPLLLQEVYEKTKNFGNATQLKYFNKIFGLEHLAGGSNLVKMAGKGELKKYIDIVNNYKGTAKRIAGIQLSGVEGQTKLLGSALDNLSIKMSRNLLPDLKDTIKGITTVVNKVEHWASAHPKLSGNIYKTALALGVGTVALATFGFVASGVASAIGFLSMPLVAVAGIATAGYLLWKDYGNGLVFVKGALDGAKDGFRDILSVARGIGRYFSIAKDKVISFSKSIGLISQDAKLNFLSRANGATVGKYAVYTAGIYATYRAVKMLKGAFFGVSKASKASCGAMGCIGASALTNTKIAKGALIGLLNKVKSLALFLRANPIVVGVTLAGAGVAWINKHTFKEIESKHFAGLNKKQLEDKVKYLQTRLKEMRNPGIKEYFLYGKPDKYTIKQMEKRLHRAKYLLHRATVKDGVGITPSNNTNYTPNGATVGKSLKLKKDGVGEKLPVSSLLKQNHEFKSKLQQNQQNFTKNSNVVHQTIGNVNINVKTEDGHIDEHELQRQVMRAIKNAMHEDRDTQFKDAV